MDPTDFGMLRKPIRRKVLMVVGCGDYTGASKMAHLYGLAFRASGWEVEFLVGEAPADKQGRLKDHLSRDGFAYSEEEGFFQLVCPGLVARVSTLVKNAKPNLVVSCVQVDLKVVGPACRRCGVPYVVFDQTVHRFYGPRVLRVIKEWAFGREMRGALAIVAVARNVSEDAVTRFGCSSKRVFAVPNGVDTTEYHDACLHRSNATETQSKVRLLSIGRLDQQKGHLVLLEALQLAVADRLPVELSIAGDVSPQHLESAAYAEKLRQYVAGCELRETVAFLGWQNDVALLCSTHDAYIHSALWEGPPLPLAVLEAMASGLPVVITDCAGWPDGFVEGVHGWVAKAGDVDSLASAIRRISQLAADERRRMGEACRCLVVERYDVTATGQRFVKICEEVVAGKLAR